MPHPAPGQSVGSGERCPHLRSGQGGSCGRDRAGVCSTAGKEPAGWERAAFSPELAGETPLPVPLGGCEGAWSPASGTARCGSAQPGSQEVGSCVTAGAGGSGGSRATCWRVARLGQAGAVPSSAARRWCCPLCRGCWAQLPPPTGAASHWQGHAETPRRSHSGAGAPQTGQLLVCCGAARGCPVPEVKTLPAFGERPFIPGRQAGTGGSQPLTRGDPQAGSSFTALTLPHFGHRVLGAPAPPKRGLAPPGL